MTSTEGGRGAQVVPRTIRRFWPDPFPVGRASLNFNWDDVDSDSVVLVTASEYIPKPNPPPGANLQRKANRSASVRIANISPHGPPFDNNHGVTFSISIDLSPFTVDSPPLFIVTDITLFDDKPVETQD
jgi:hypothetical protein